MEIPEHVCISEGLEGSLIHLERHLKSKLTYDDYDRADNLLSDLKSEFYKMRDLVNSN